ncbi:MAG: ribosome biogenesis GTPase Der [Bacilli bacterium]
MNNERALVAIVGSPNVGKSTLFNRLIGEQLAIVDDASGITRDRQYGVCNWLNHSFSLIDTGGIETKDNQFQSEIRIQAEIAMDEADVIVFVVDAKLGVTKDDILVSKILRKSKKPIIFVVNKVDEGTHASSIHDFYSLALGEPLAVSSAHGVGIGDLLNKIISLLPNKNNEDNDEDRTTFCLIGRPNVGKSSLTNAILNEERVIVSDISGTTRDSIDTPFVKDGKNYTVIDTAGLKKRGKIYESIDKYSAIRALKAIERSEIVLLLIDASKGIQEQDKHVVSYALDLAKAVIIVVNKWDLIEKDQSTMNEFIKDIRDQYKFLSYAPIVFLSAKTKARLNTLFTAIDMVHEAYQTRIKTSILNDVLNDAQLMNQSPNFNGGRLKIYYASQVSVAPPTIVLFVNDPKFMHFSYQRYIENRLRDTFNFDGTPIRIVLRKKNKE